MVLEREAFIDAMTALGELQPMGKALSPAAVALAWGLFPLPAKELLTPEHLLYAMQQLQADPEPQRELSVPQQLLRYVFPLRDGKPNYEQGLRPDLVERMQRPEVFHPLRVEAAHRAVEEVIDQRLRLQPAAGGALEQVTKVVRPLLLAAKAAREEGQPKAQGVFEQQQLAAGALLAAGSLVGRWTLESLGPQSLAQRWIREQPAGWAAMQAAARERYGS